MEIRNHGNWGHGLKPGTTSDINCPSCKREDEPKRWRLGDGTIRLTRAEASWLINQPGAPGITWIAPEDWKPWAGPGFTRRNDESADA